MNDIDVDGTMMALAEPVRRRVVELLRERPCRAGELAQRTGASFPTMSRHLRVLRRGGLVEEQRDERDARVHLYRLRPEPFRDLEAWAQQMHALWSEQMDAFKTHVERRRDEGAR